MTEKIDKLADELFTREVLPLAQGLKGQGVALLETRYRQDEPTYWVTRSHRTMTKADFERGGVASSEAAAGAFAALWPAGSPLAPLAPSMAKLALQIRQTHEITAEVSQFVYAMY